MPAYDEIDKDLARRVAHLMEHHGDVLDRVLEHIEEVEFQRFITAATDGPLDADKTATAVTSANNINASRSFIATLRNIASSATVTSM